MPPTNPENVEARIAEHVRNALRGEIRLCFAHDIAKHYASEVVKILGPARASEIGEQVHAAWVLWELQLQMSLPTSKWPKKFGGIYIARKLAWRFTRKWWWRLWKGFNMEYMEVPRDVGPDGNALCSDDSCPCGSPGAKIQRGEGYIYVSKDVADFRKDCPSTELAQLKIQRMGAQLGAMIVAGSTGVFRPILMCKLGAKNRGIDLEVAAEDARHWWKTGLVPIRPTPLAG